MNVEQLKRLKEKVKIINENENPAYKDTIAVYNEIIEFIIDTDLSKYKIFINCEDNYLKTIKCISKNVNTEINAKKNDKFIDVSLLKSLLREDGIKAKYFAEFYDDIEGLSFIIDEKSLEKMIVKNEKTGKKRTISKFIS